MLMVDIEPLPPATIAIFYNVHLVPKPKEIFFFVGVDDTIFLG